LWQLCQKPLAYVLVYFFLINAIVWMTAFFSGSLEARSVPHKQWVQYGLWMASLVISLPFVMAIIRNLNATCILVCETALRGLFRKMQQNHVLFRLFRWIILTLSWVGFWTVFLTASGRFLPSYVSLLTFTILALVLIAFFWKDFNRANSQIELLFMESFQMELESENEKRKRAVLKKMSRKHTWDIGTQTLTLPKFSKYAGKRILDTPFRRLTGASILGISREGFLVYDPSPESCLFPGDQMVVLGTPDQIERASMLLEEKEETVGSAGEDTIDLDQVVLTAGNPLVHQTLADANIRFKFGVNVVGIERGQNRLHNPAADEMLREGDILLIVGNPRDIEAFKKVLVVE
jgi:CPA2 family monovalent cation:H+ antiporter-2